MSEPDHIPGSPLGPKHVRMLKIAIAIMTALLIVGVIALIYGAARQAGRIASGEPDAGTGAAGRRVPYSQTVAIGGSELKSVTASNALIVLHVKGQTDEDIITLEAQTGKEIGRLRISH